MAGRIRPGGARPMPGAEGRPRGRARGGGGEGASGMPPAAKQARDGGPAEATGRLLPPRPRRTNDRCPERLGFGSGGAVTAGPRPRDDAPRDSVPGMTAGRSSASASAAASARTAVPEPVAIARRLRRRLRDLEPGPPAWCTYRPLDHARRPAEAYLSRWARPGIEVLFVGMNPGPFGMVQTGVPFGEVAAVRDFLGIDGRVDRPAVEHPKRPVEGFDCPRSEVSGRRLWGWVRDRFGTPEAFFRRCFVWNWCPLAFMDEGGRNVTPDKLAAADRAAIEAACDRSLVEMIEHLGPRLVVGVGGFAAKRAAAALRSAGLEDRVRVGTILHPSPASPLANRGWAAQAERQLAELGLALSESGSS